MASGNLPAGVLRTSLFANGPEYYFAARIHLRPELFAAAAPLEAGQTSAPVLSGGRWHILVVRKNERPRPLPLAEVYDSLLGDYRREKSAKLEAANARFLRRRADIQVSDDLQ
jgi:parvulin-like peptidyl-prolyl isomerase